jgi:predicted RNA-binding Zn ribbon-like protein
VTAQASIPGEREHPSLALVNSRHHSRTGMVDHLASPEKLWEWLAWRSLLPRGGPSDAAAGAAPADGETSGAAAGAAPADGETSGADGARAEDLDTALALREAVRELFVAAVERRSPALSAVQAVNDAAALAPAADQLRWGRAGPVRVRSSPTATDLQSALAALAEDAIALVCDHRGDLIACEAPGCVRLLLKDHPRRHWCSTRCGDRVRAARYYRRSRENAS